MTEKKMKKIKPELEINKKMKMGKIKTPRLKKKSPFWNSHCCFLA